MPGQDRNLQQIEDVPLPEPARSSQPDLEEALIGPLHELAGEASMCWDPRPSSAVFDATAVVALAKRTATRIVHILEERKAVAVLDGIDREEADCARLGRDLVAILQCHCGERGNSEGAVATLHRIVLERDRAERKLAELDPEIVRRVSAEMRLSGKR